MVSIERRDPYGNKGFKEFNSLKDAFKWLKSDSVKQDIKDGFVFSFVDKSEEDADSGG